MTSMRTRSCLAPFLLGAMSLAAAATATGPTRPETIKVVHQPRPLAALLEDLGKRLQIAITYEDPVYAYAGDLEDVTDEVAREPARRRAEGRPILVPAKSDLEIGFTVAISTGLPDDPAAVVQAAVDAHAAAGNPGRFRLLRDSLGLHVVPAAVRDPAGRWSPAVPVLDTAIDLPAADRTRTDTVRAVVAAVSAATGTRVVLGMVAIPAGRESLHLGASREPARQVLETILGHLPRKVFWQLLYDHTTGQYYFNLEPVPSRS